MEKTMGDPLTDDEMFDLVDLAMEQDYARRPKRWRVRPILAWYAFQLGWFYDRDKRRLYIFPLPMVGLVIFRERQDPFTNEWF